MIQKKCIIKVSCDCDICAGRPLGIIKTYVHDCYEGALNKAEEEFYTILGANGRIRGHIWHEHLKGGAK